MRRTILASLVMVPVLAHAAVGKPADAVASISTMNTAIGHAEVREAIEARYSGSFAEAALREGGTLEYSMKGNAPLTMSAPKVTKTVELQLSQQELSEQPAVSSVVVKAIVDENGIPRNVAIAKSAGSIVDQKAIAAVSQYRFTPATVDNQPTWSNVAITIKIQK